MDIFIQQLINGLVLGAIYALVALGYTMVYGILGLINFAHGEVVMIGALVALSVIQLLAGSGVALPGPAIAALGLLVAMPVCMLLGYTIERVAYRPLRAAPRLDAAHHRDRRLDRAAERGHDHLGPQLPLVPGAACPRPRATSPGRP